jgi:hypothetical protein
VPVNIHDIPFGYKLLLWASHKARVLNTTGQCPSGAELMIELSQMVLLWMNYITVHTVHYHQMIHANDHSDRGEHVIYNILATGRFRIWWLDKNSLHTMFARF